MNVNFKNSNYKTGEPIELIIDIQGIGNIKVIHPPILKNAQNIKIYENQKVIISIQKNEKGIYDKKTLKIYYRTKRTRKNNS